MSQLDKQLSSSYELLDSRIQKWIWEQGWTSLKDIQESSIPIVIKRRTDVIISAATAGGKTEAAFLPILTYLLQQKSSDGFQVLYISPLKALINDQYRRLTEMTKGLNIEVTPWHGDISILQKNKVLQKPRGILIITPESLESFFVNRSWHLSIAFSSLSYIVIDELHSFIGTERGKQLQSLLSRIENISAMPIPRIAMSATFSDYDVAKNYLRADDTIPCIVPPQGESNYEIKILVKEYQVSKASQVEEKITKELYTKLRGSNNLIFVNSRQEAEQYTVTLSELSKANFVPNEFRIHHGSLSKIERENVEKELQESKYPISAVCTTTLELGVDIGKVNSIAQIGTAFSVSGLRQRLGRSGRRGEPALLRVFSVEHDIPLLKELRSSLVQNVAIIELLKRKQYESPLLSSFHFSTLIQQLLSLLAEHGAFYPKEGWLFLCHNGAFRNVNTQLFLELLQSLGAKKVISQTHNGQIVIGIEGENIIKKIDFYTAFSTTTDYVLINKENSKELGSIQYLPKVGNTLIFAGKRWRVDSISNTFTIHVSQIKIGGTIKFSSEGYDVNRLITNEMLQIYASVKEFAYLDYNANNELNEGRVFFKENFRGNTFISFGRENAFFTWSGTKINRTISLILEYNLGLICPFNHLAVYNVEPIDIKSVYQKGAPNLLELASLEERIHKQKQKYDYLLSDKLLNLEYANTYLDLEGACNVLKKCCH